MPNDDADTESSEKSGFVRTQIQPAADTAEYEFIKIIAELEGKEMDEIPSLYTELDHLITNLFQNPPSPESQVALSFSYAGYRVTITQQGMVELIPVKNTAEGSE